MGKGTSQYFLASLLVLLTLAASAPRQGISTDVLAQKVVKITTCTDITQPGYYIITNNITGGQAGKGYCIGIFASNVVLDG